MTVKDAIQRAVEIVADKTVDQIIKDTVGVIEAIVKKKAFNTAVEQSSETAIFKASDSCATPIANSCCER